VPRPYDVITFDCYGTLIDWEGGITEAFAREAGYATPKVDVRAAAFIDGQVLLVREISDGGWTLPGGWADVNQGIFVYSN